MEQLGRTGRDPGMVFLDDGTLVLGYGHCRDDANQELCNAREDGVRLSIQATPGARLVRHTLAGDAEDNEGIGTDIAQSGAREVVVVHLNSSRNKLVVQRVAIN